MAVKSKMGIENIKCFRCEKLGHIAAECAELFPAATAAEHQARIARYVERWINHEITEYQKRAFITAENEMWHSVPARSST